MPGCRSRLALLTVAVGLSVTPALADTFGAQAHWINGSTHVHGLELEVAPSVSEPSVLSGSAPRLWGYGTLQGVSLRAEVLLDSTRLGVGTSIFEIDGVSLKTDTLPAGIEARAESVWGSTIELFLGRELGQGPVYPYIDGRLSFSIVQAEIGTYAEPYGHVGTTHYNGVRFGLGPRLGMLVPIGHSTMLDFTISQRLFGGVEETTIGIGLGYWENDRTDDFSEELRGHHWRGQI